MPSPTANVTSNMVANLDYKRLRDGRLIALMLAAKRVPRMQAGRIRGGEMPPLISQRLSKSTKTPRNRRRKRGEFKVLAWAAAVALALRRLNV
jgi:hypothetical protein